MIENNEQQAQPPFLSVILPVYNGEKYLADAIDSVLVQTYINFELIIINDASTDGSLKILESYLKRDPRIRVITRANRGLPATLNEAVDNSQGKYIVRMDQDDICHPDRFLIQMEFLLNHSDVVAVGSAAIYIDQDGRMICTYFPDTEDEVLRKKFPESPFVHPSVMFSKEAFYNSGKYTEKMRWGGEDVTLFERMSRIGKLHNLNVPLIYYRLMPGSMSRKPAVFRNLLSKIIEDEIAGINVSKERFEALQRQYKSIDRSKAIFDYHFEVAKLYIWSGGDRVKIFIHLNKCFLQHNTLKVFFAYLLALLPRYMVRKIYLVLKERRFERVESE